MANHSIYNGAAPPGTFALYTDGNPSIALVHQFYVFGAGVPGGSIVGGAFWIPVGATGIPAQARVQVYNNNVATGTPAASKVININAGPGQWQTFTLDTSLSIPAVGVLMAVVVKFEPATHENRYVYAANGRSSDGPVVSSTLSTLAWAERASGPSGVGYRLPADATTLSPSAVTTASYGIDITISDSVPPGTSLASSVAFGDNVASENALLGSLRSVWYDGVTAEAIPGFGRSTYFEPGSPANFSINYNLNFNVEIYRLGYYDSTRGARLIGSFAGTPVAQPAPTVIPNSNGAVSCSSWSVNASWAVPLDATPGWYYALLKGANGTDFGYILFCVTDKQAKRPVVIVTGDATWHAAYNGFGGNNVYGAVKAIGNADTRALCSTYDKPVITGDYVPQTHFFNNTYPYLKWSERMGINAGHTTIEQIKNDPTILDGRSVIIFVGHNEYVPDVVYDKVTSLLAAGQKIMNLAGNDFFWRVRFTNGAFDSGVNGRVMWCKKDTLAGPSAIRTGGAGTPFTNSSDWTGTWQDTRWAIRRPSEDTFGDRFIANGIRNDAVRVPASMKTSPAWRDCAGIQGLASGQAYNFIVGSLGMEWDTPVLTNPNVTQSLFSSATIDLTGNASDINGQNYNETVAAAVHGFSMVKKTSGLIANFNSDQWSWALEGHHMRSTLMAYAGDANAHQMMLNVLYDFGAVATASRVTASGLVVPTPVADPFVSYGLTSAPVTPPPTGTGLVATNDQLLAAGYKTYIMVRL